MPWGWPCSIVQSLLVRVRVCDHWSYLLGFFLLPPGEFLFVFDPFPFDLLQEVAPNQARRVTRGFLNRVLRP